MRNDDSNACNGDAGRQAIMEEEQKKKKQLVMHGKRKKNNESIDSNNK